ncbi:epsin-3 isoform X2 [Melanotaenia boesemani]|uniref:epsin-3 isoform X2 n=1 Tax=Melanotaenia boesemani TaxID=1250792 RepID=UPI001C03E246|nr:epsin-3 isoform X2 [Melanotaenia boesemani]
MQTSSLRRQMKNMVNNYTEAEVKVREATSNDHWGPSSSLMAEIADLTFNVVAFAEVMGMIWKRLNDHGKNWRHVYKALTLVDYLVKTGSERVAKECRDNIYTIQTLRDFQYIDRDGRDQGVNVREKAKQLVALLRDEEKLKKERSQALKTKSRMAGVTSSVSSGSMPPPYPGRHTASSYGDDFSGCRGSPSSNHPSSPQLAPDLEQARPSTTGEEELQLQLALAMSREESEKSPPTVDIDEQTQLQIAMTLSKEEAKKPVQRGPARNMDMDEDSQLQLALSLSKEEHQQEQLSRQGDESLLQKALEESKREMEAKGGTSFMDLVDVFAVATDPPPNNRGWKNAPPQAATGGRGSDPWDSLDSTNIPRADSPWMVPPTSNSPPPPWEPPANPWDAPQSHVSSLNPASQVWAFPANTASPGVDPFSALSERTASKGTVKEAPPRSVSPSDGDLFDEAMDGGQVSINGREEGSPEPFDLSRLRETLAAPSPRTCQTPEAFLGPTAASLVNLDSLIPANPSAKNKNPFLSGLSAPSPTNPFQSEQPKLSLNQMGSSSTSVTPQATSLPYSASLPLPMSHQGASIPSSLTHPTHPGLDLPRNLPEPLLPFSSASSQGSDAAQNPFL